MAHAQILASVKDQPIETLPFIAWKEAALALGGDETPDEAFLAELLVTFYHEAVPHVQRLMAACLAYREDENALFCWQEGKKPDPMPRTIERVLKEEAHALKGSAANLRLYRLARAAEEVELPAKRLMNEGEDTLTADEFQQHRKLLLDSMCRNPCTGVKRLVSEFRDLAVFMTAGGDGAAAGEKGSFKGSFSADFDLEADLPPEQQDQYHAITLQSFDESLTRKYQSLWLEGETLPGNVGTGTGTATGGRDTVAPTRSPGQPSQPLAAGSQGQQEQQQQKEASSSSAPSHQHHQLPDLGSQDSSAPLTGSAAAAAAAAAASTVVTPAGVTSGPPVAAAPAAAAPSFSQPPSSSSSAGPAPAPAPAPQPLPPPPPAAAIAVKKEGGGCCVVQ